MNQISEKEKKIAEGYTRLARSIVRQAKEDIISDDRRAFILRTVKSEPKRGKRELLRKVLALDKTARQFFKSDLFYFIRDSIDLDNCE